MKTSLYVVSLLLSSSMLVAAGANPTQQQQGRLGAYCAQDSFCASNCCQSNICATECKGGKLSRAILNVSIRADNPIK